MKESIALLLDRLMRAGSLLVLAACAAPPPAAGRADPAFQEVPLPCASGWNAFLLHEAGVGVWTVESFRLLDDYGCPEVIGLDDMGRVIALACYSGKWTPRLAVGDGLWLGGIAHGDLDPRVPGAELYVGGRRGVLYQVSPRPAGAFDVRRIAEFPGEEIHTLVLGDLLPDAEGLELLAFLGSGQVFRVRQDQPGFAAHALGKLPGRVRDAVLLPAAPGAAPWIAAVSRSGEVALLRLGKEGLERQTILSEPMGLGRIDLRPAAAGAPHVLYVCRDDGLVLRLEREPGGAWRREPIYAGPQGPRGIAAGRFHADPGRETVALFGYSRSVQLLARANGGAWEVETLYTDAGQGHWLATAELDGRNATDELVGSGYSGRIFLLARPPGYGLPGVPTGPEPGPPHPLTP